MNKRLFSFYLTCNANTRTTGVTPPLTGCVVVAWIDFTSGNTVSPPATGIHLGWAPGGGATPTPNVTSGSQEINVPTISTAPYEMLIERAITNLSTAFVPDAIKQGFFQDAANPFPATGRNAWGLYLPVPCNEGDTGSICIATASAIGASTEVIGNLMIWENVPQQYLSRALMVGMGSR